MKIQIDKQLILEKSKLMLGVNHGFHDGSLPNFAITNFSNPSTLKPDLQKDDRSIAQDLGLRIGSQLLSKATIGGLTYGALEGAKQLAMDDPDSLDPAYTVVPSLGAAWVGSNMIQDKMPGMHKKAFKDKSIYK